MSESRNTYGVLVKRPEGKRPLGRPRRRWEDNIKMDLREVGYDDRDWINLAQDRDQWRAYVRAAMNLRNCNSISPESTFQFFPTKAFVNIIDYISHLRILNEAADRVNSFKYLGCTISSNVSCRQEVKRRIAIAKESFNRKRNIFCGPLEKELRMRIVKCFVWSVVLYGAETWTLRQMK
ncbi:hypothetical protein ANN_09387 [Periplaneta americana]|uniref:Uncharacterized protein n=1 Tax=Periplaneta americana TaxID=6978 RepID=A0ABQ8TMP0_PERAM|nr:hypothetical protein ANN_09387 [Periplaneta americana]